MTSDRLSEHYDLKYGQEDGQTAAPVMPMPTGLPTDRYTGALSFLPPRLTDDSDVLELGAGSGVVAESLRQGGARFRSYTLSDMSEVRASALARKFPDPRFSAAQVNAENAAESLAGRQFDAVIMIALIEHLVDPLRAMEKLHGLLKPGGFVYIDTPNIAKWTRRVKLAMGKFPSTASTDEGLRTYYGEPVDLHDEGHLHYFTFGSLERMLTQRCGFSRCERLGYYIDGRAPAVGHRLAARRPELFSEIVMIAYA